MDSNKLTDQKDEWQNIWLRRGPITTLVDTGRNIYNWFFRRYLRKYINVESRLLEVGCGTATLTLSVANEIKELVGIDITDESIRLSKYRANELGVKNSNFEIGDCLNIAFNDEFDVVWSQGLLEHFDDPYKVAEEHYKATKIGGITLISVPYRYSYHALWYLLTRPKFLRQLWPWTTQVFYNKKQLLNIGQKLTPQAKVHFLQPFPLGIAILELPK